MDIAPATANELAECLAEANSRNKRIQLAGNSTKQRMAGPIAASDIRISTAALNRVIEYEPRDLTVSVGAGITYCELSRVLAEQRQMLPLDPPFADQATMGGIVAANASGPRQRLYGSVRDMVIGMTFATLEGKLVRTGGMVVKNVAGLDMGKLMIGSFGTLAAIATLNFRVYPMPEARRTFIVDFEHAAQAIEARDRVVKSFLQPAAIDIVKTGGRYRLAIQAGGSGAVLDRYSHELSGMRSIDGVEEKSFWREIREFVPDFLAQHDDGAVVRTSCTLSEVGAVLEAYPDRALARAGSGVCYGCFTNADQIRFPAVGTSVVEYAPQSFRERETLWPVPGNDFAMMEKVKSMFDPEHLLNRGRMYGRI